MARRRSYYDSYWPRYTPTRPIEVEDGMLGDAGMAEAEDDPLVGSAGVGDIAHGARAKFGDRGRIPADPGIRGRQGLGRQSRGVDGLTIRSTGQVVE